MWENCSSRHSQRTAGVLSCLARDLDTFNQPWKGLVRLQKGQEPYSEFVCAEGNLNLFDYGVPKAKTPDF